MKLSTIATGTEVLFCGLAVISSIEIIYQEIGAVKALKRIHSEWNDIEKNQKYVEQRVQAAVGNLLTALGSLVFGTSFCCISALNIKALVFGGADLATKTAALNFAVPLIGICIPIIVTGLFLVPSGAPSIFSENPI